MFPDFVSAVQAGVQFAPGIVAQHQEGWCLYNPTGTLADDAPPHILLTENGMLVPLNQGGAQVLCTYAITAGHA
ncbi:hypothetical protein [Chitinimonas sp.]|uniref:hypothetical protein n=1 Tax=Chitinimonas sp. TaxID=1934313 RepID=UPI0035AFCB54